MIMLLHVLTMCELYELVLLYIFCSHRDGWLSKLGSFLGTLNIRCRTILGIQKGHSFDNHPANPDALA